MLGLASTRLLLDRNLRCGNTLWKFCCWYLVIRWHVFWELPRQAMPPSRSSSCSAACMGHRSWSYHCEAYLITWLLLNNILFWEGSEFFNSNLDEELTSRITTWANDMYFRSLIWEYHQQRHVGVKSICEALTKYTQMSVSSMIVRFWCNV